MQLIVDLEDMKVGIAKHGLFLISILINLLQLLT